MGTSIKIISDKANDLTKLINNIKYKEKIKKHQKKDTVNLKKCYNIAVFAMLIYA